MSNLLMLVTRLLAGMLLRQTGRAPDQAHVAINAVTVHVAARVVDGRAPHPARAVDGAGMALGLLGSGRVNAHGRDGPNEAFD